MTTAGLSLFELPPDLVRPALMACRFGNTALDALFYDLPTLTQQLLARGAAIVTGSGVTTPGAAKPTGLAPLDLSAWSNPEGALLTIDPANAPYIVAYADYPAFIRSRGTPPAPIAAVTLTGVGSSALGSAALAWNVATALGAPVVAIVPGYGLADVVLQALGGWFGFGLHDALRTKSHAQDALALLAPQAASVGRNLVGSLPHAARAVTNAPVFRTGSGSSDVLHQLMKDVPVRCVVGHSKGALSIANALGSLDAALTNGLRIVTLGCPVAKSIGNANYHQFLGLFDALGQANAWFNRPDEWTPTEHSTNMTLPLSMSAEKLVTQP